MEQYDPRVDAYIDKSADFAKPNIELHKGSGARSFAAGGRKYEMEHALF